MVPNSMANINTPRNNTLICLWILQVSYFVHCKIKLLVREVKSSPYVLRKIENVFDKLRNAFVLKINDFPPKGCLSCEQTPAVCKIQSRVRVPHGVKLIFDISLRADIVIQLNGSSRFCVPFPQR